HILSPPCLVHRMIIQNRSSLEAELVNQGRSHNALVRPVQWLEPWNSVLLRARLSQTDVALHNVGGIKGGYVGLKSAETCTEGNIRPNTDGWHEDTPDLRHESQIVLTCLIY